MKVLSYNVGPVNNNMYAIVDDLDINCIFIDPGLDSRRVWAEFEEKHYQFSFILNTHAHLDHIYENAFFKLQTGALLGMHPDAAKTLSEIPGQAAWFGIPPPAPFDPDRMLKEGDSIFIGEGRLRVIDTPGHSPGGICFIGDNFVIAGDILFAGSVGRTDLPGGDMPLLLDSIRSKLLSLPDHYTVYPGHGPITTIGEQRQYNPFLKESR